MGTFEVNNVNTLVEESRTTVTKCPKCGNKITPVGTFLQYIYNIPVKVKILFISITLGVEVDLRYCPKCGYLKTNIEQA